MSELGWNGRELKIAIGATVIAAVRSKRVSFSADMIDITDGEQDGYRRLLGESDTRTVSVSVDGVTTEDNWPLLRDHWAGNTFSDVRILNPDGTVVAAPDGAFMSALTHNGQHKGFVAFSASFIFSGGEGDGSSWVPAPVIPSAPVLTAEVVEC